MAATAIAAQPRSPFGIEVALKPGIATNILRVNFTIPPECILYAERLHFLTEDGDELTPSKIPAPLTELDQSSGKGKKVYERSFGAELALTTLVNDRLVIKFQGCSNAACFFPEKRTFALTTNAAASIIFTEITAPTTTVAVSGSDWAKEMHGFKVAGQQSGYLSSKNFLSFLDRAESGQDNADDPLARFKKAGLAATLLLILLGGVLLNLTPCILPMIPINLAIIGAGSAAASRMTGFKNGAIYGAGMALAYSVLGLGVVLTGSKFGTINSSVWFNLLIAAVFMVLALG
ncbi:MAG: hypothetical protein JWQ04_780, partial [Pedosphaera sp.]|nr:hypothetical protein [Pedosphaera sp.]